MSSVLRLVRTYFAGTPLACGLTVSGLIALVVGNIAAFLVPPWTVGTGIRTDISELQEFVVVALPWIAVLMLFFSSTLMPATVDRLALGRQICVLPHGRLRLLGSAVATASLIATATAGSSAMAFYRYPVEISLVAVFARTFAVAFTGFGYVYVAVWILSKLRSGPGLLAGSLLVIVSLGLALRYIGSPQTDLPLPVWLGLLAWAAFGALLLAGQRVAHAIAGARARLAALRARLLPPQAYRAGSETDLLLGTTRPWMLALGQGVPIGIAAWYIPLPAVWLFFLVLFGAISGAATSYAAARSRRLWLRLPLSRAELFRLVERSFWRYFGYTLCVLLLLLAVVGSYLGFESSLIALGLPLVLLGAAMSVYLGLMMTKGLGWRETLLGLGTMLLLVWATFATARADPALDLAIGLQIAVASLALLYRSLAKGRWHGLDWALCRADTLQTARRPH